MQICGISEKELIRETNVTFKGGIMFKNWTKNNYYHNTYGTYVVQNLHGIKAVTHTQSQII